MFERSLIERAKGGRPWTMAGFAIQMTMLCAALAVPLFYPDILAVPIAKIGVLIPLRPTPEAERPAASAPSKGPAKMRMAPVPAFIAPTDYNHPVATFVDGPELSIPILNPTVAAGHGVEIAFGSGMLPGTIAPPPAKPPEVKKPAIEQKPFPVGGKVQEAMLLHRVLPVYPPLARQARISGMVRLEGIIGKDGVIQQLRVISGHPLLTKAALDAVQQWRYRPTYLNGVAVEVLAPIDVNFVLSQ